MASAARQVGVQQSLQSVTSYSSANRNDAPLRKRSRKKHPMMHLLAGGVAGFVESTCCHPLDTIKTRTQLQQGGNASAALQSVHPPKFILQDTKMSHGSSTRKFGVGKNAAPTVSSSASASTGTAAVCALQTQPQSKMPVGNLGAIGTAHHIIQHEGPRALYKGLTAVYTGIVPKMAIRFLSFEQYREVLHSLSGGTPATATTPVQFAPSTTFFAGLMAGLTEAILIVTPAEVCKIRMQSQSSSTFDASQHSRRKYTNVAQTAFTIVREEGLGALYKGVVPTMMRQGCNQAVNFTTYNFFKKKVTEWRKERGEPADLLPWQSLILGGISGGFGPVANNPLDVVKTRMQKQIVHPGVTPKYNGLYQSCALIAKEEGVAALWKGIGPRLLRIMPGQAITFMTYESVTRQMNQRGLFVSD